MGRNRTCKVYCVKAENSDQIYIGSTILSLKCRLNRHKNPNSTTRASILLQHGDLSITLLETVDNKEELRQREMHYINTYKENGHTVINKNKPVRI